MSLYICTNTFRGTNCFMRLSLGLCVAYLSQVERQLNTPWTTRWITYVPSAAWICVGALSAHLATVISWTVLVLCRCKAVYLQYCRVNVWGESSHKAQPAKAKRHSPGLGSTHGTLETNQSRASENLKKAHRHRRWGSRSSTISTTWSSTYPRSGSEHTHTKTHTHMTRRFCYTNMGITQSVMAPLTKIPRDCAHHWLMYGRSVCPWSSTFW